MIAAQTPSLAEMLRRRLEEQLNNVDRLRSVSERQRRSLCQKQFDQLSEQEREKQTLLQLIRSRDQELDRLRHAWSSDEQKASPEERKEIEALLERLRSNVRTIAAIEGDNITLVQQLREEIDSELQKLIGRKQVSRYPGPKFVQGRFLDTTG